MSPYDPNEEIGWGFKAIVTWGIGILVVIFLGIMGYFVIYPAILARQTEAIQNSPQFVLSAQQEIADAIEHYESLEAQVDELAKQPGNEDLIEDMRKQQASDVCEVRRAKDLMRAEQYPERLTDRARRFLEETKEVTCG